MGVLARKLLSADGRPYINELQRGAGDENTANSSTHTTGSLSIGAASSTRIVCALIVANSSTATERTITSVTIGGVSATVVQELLEVAGTVAIAYATVPTGTTAVVVVSYNGTVTSSRINTVAIDSGVELTLSDQDQSEANSTTHTNTVSVLKDSFVVTCAGSIENVTATWSNTTEWEDVSVDAGICSFHSAITRPSSDNSGLVITATISTSGIGGMITLVFD